LSHDLIRTRQKIRLAFTDKHFFLVITMQSSGSTCADSEEQSPELQALVAGLRDDALRRYAVQVSIRQSSATFSIERKTELVSYMRRMCNVRPTIEARAPSTKITETICSCLWCCPPVRGHRLQWSVLVHHRSGRPH
jgi:hypothetical protein